jgi:hypothetical protein
MLKMDSNSTSLNTSRLNKYEENLSESSHNFDISSLYSPQTFASRLSEARETGVVFTEKEIHQAVKDYYEQGKNYKQK